MNVGSVADLANIAASWVNVLSSTDKIVLIIVLIMHRIVALAGMGVYAIFTLPGTAAHECLHYGTAFILGARPSFPSLIPTKIAGGWRLGSVSFTSNLFKNIPIALAPLALAPIGLWWASDFMHKAAGVEYVGHAWVAGTLLMSSAPSGQDWWIAAPALALVGIGWLLLSYLLP